MEKIEVIISHGDFKFLDLNLCAKDFLNVIKSLLKNYVGEILITAIYKGFYWEYHANKNQAIEN